MNSSGKKGVLFMLDRVHTIKKRLSYQRLPLYIYRVLLLFSTPVFSSQTFVAVVTPFSVFFSSFKQFFSFSRILLHYRSVTNFTLQETLEVFPVRFFAIQLERILAFFFQSRVVTPQVPVTALNSLFFSFLALTHTGFQTVVDTWSVSDDQ